jgi:hypothetical protein
MADAPTKKASSFTLATTSSIADSIPIIQGGANKRIRPSSGGGLDADLVDGYQAATLYLPRGYIDGLICSNDTDTEHDISIAPGYARDSTNVMPLILASAIVKRIDAAWSAGTGAGGLDTGSVGADTVYYVWLIRKDSDGSIDALFSLSATAPTMPAGYTYKRRIMSVCTDASANIIPFNQAGDHISLNTPIVIRTYGTLTSTARQTIASKAPPNMIGIFGGIAGYSAGADAYFWIDNASRPDSAPTTDISDMLAFTGATLTRIIKNIKIDSSGNIYLKSNVSTASCGILALGWTDDRGRNA